MNRVATLLVLFLLNCSFVLGQAAVQWSVAGPQEGKPAYGYPPISGVEHFEVYHATPETGMFSHHAHITHTQGGFLAFWSNHPNGEDGPGQRILCSTSRDGRRWKPAFECFPAMGETRPAQESGRVLTANGWVLADGIAYAIAEVDDTVRDSSQKLALPTAPSHAKRGEPYLGRTGWGRLARSVSAEAKLGPIFWLVDDPPDANNGGARYPDARDRRFAQLARRINTILSDPLHMAAWDFRYRTAWTFGEDGHLLCEPSVFRRADGTLVKLSRDRLPSLRMYAAVSSDGGKTWGPAYRTDIPDAPSKAVSGTLPDGRVYLVGNQVPAAARGKRDPLVLSLSRDGRTFTWAGVIRSDAPAVRAAGRAKGLGFQYPSAVVVGDSLWVIYSIGKEDVAVSRVSLASLGRGAS